MCCYVMTIVLIATLQWCTDCRQLTLSTYPWSDFTDVEEVQAEVVYPAPFAASDMPSTVAKAYTDALKARPISAPLFAAGMRMTLESICDEAGVARSRLNRQGKTTNVPLWERILQLALPPSMLALVNHLRELGNLGAHGVAVDEDQLLIARQLTEALLDYLYRAPAALESSLARASERGWPSS